MVMLAWAQMHYSAWYKKVLELIPPYDEYSHLSLQEKVDAEECWMDAYTPQEFVDRALAARNANGV